METANWQIWTPDNSDNYALVQDLARTADDIDEAISNSSYRSGPTGTMNATQSRYMEVWHNTSNGLRYVGNKTGGWRRFEGVRTFTNSGWQFSDQGTYARTISGIFFDTVLEPNETFQVTTLSAGAGYGAGFLQSVVLPSTSTSTEITIRHIQWGAATLNPITVYWQLVAAYG